jgi:hypothetical protein
MTKFDFVIPIEDFIRTDPFQVSEKTMHIVKAAVKEGCKFAAIDKEQNIHFLKEFPEGVTKL